MPTFACARSNNQLIFISHISLPGQSGLAYRSLFDTGASVTVISPSVVGDLGLSALRPGELTMADGHTTPTRVYRVRVDIPVDDTRVLPDGSRVPAPVVRGTELEVLALPYEPPNYKVILGMDLISLFHATLIFGDLYLSN